MNSCPFLELCRSALCFRLILSIRSIVLHSKNMLTKVETHSEQQDDLLGQGQKLVACIVSEKIRDENLTLN